MADDSRTAVDREEHCRGSNGLVGWMLLLALAGVFSIEIFALQEGTLVGGGSKLRLILVAFYCLAFVALLPRWAVAIGFAVVAMAAQVLFFYRGYFNKPLSWLTASTQWDEGWESSSLDGAFLDSRVVTITLIALAINVTLLLMTRRWPLPSWRRRSTVGGLAVAAYLSMFAGLCGFTDRPISSVKTWFTFENTASHYGYLPAWASQWWYLDSESLLADALRVRDEATDRITPLEGPLAIPGGLVIIQAESLDDAVMGRVVDGEPVTPFLSEMQRRSMRFRISAVHHNGSCDADFVLLHAYGPSRDVANYRIHGFPHDDTLPSVVRDAGLSMRFLHGYTGRFFNRRERYEQMGFSDLLFYEELTQRHELPGYAGAVVQDQHVFETSARLINETPELFAHFIITMTSHTPFTLLPEKAPRPYKDPSMDFMARRYLNSIRYLDACIGDYVSRLPTDTTVIIYADHESNVAYDGYRRDDHHEYVPLIVYRVGDDLSAQQRTAGQDIAMSGELNLIDAAVWIRRSVAAAANAHVPQPNPNDQPEQPIVAPAVEPQNNEPQRIDGAANR